MCVDAYIIAKEWHDGQRYGELPYIEHIDAVTNKVRFLYHGDDDISLLLRLACLHDIFEDTKCSEQEVRDRLTLAGCDYIDRLIDGMYAISKTENESRNEYIARCSLNQAALKVKIADTVSNLEWSVKTGDLRRIKKYTNQLETLSKIQLGA